MELWQKELINRACASETFRDLRYLGELLLYLAQHSRPEDRHLRTERAIRDQVFGNQNFTIGTEMTRLQAHLDEYFDTWGRREEVRIVIRRADKGKKPSDLYTLAFPFNVGAELYTKLFWKPHMVASEPTVIVYTEPLFTRDIHTSRFVRDVHVNNEQHPLPEGQVGCYPYAPIGEVACLLQLKRWFTLQGIPTMEQGVRAENRLKDLRPYPAPSDYILLGAPRANGVIRSLQDQQDCDIVADEDRIIVRETDGSSTSYREEDRERYVVGYVVVSRLRAPHGNWVTMFYGNHGKAIERMGHLFTSETELATLFEQQREMRTRDKLPDHFQLLFEVRIDDKEREPGRHSLRAARLCTGDR